MRLEMKIDTPDAADEKTAVVELSETRGEYKLNIDGQSVDAALLSQCRGELDLQVDGRRIRAYVADAGTVVAGDARQVFMDGRTVTVRLPSEDDDVAEAGQAGGPNLVAEMPGKIVKLLVEAGQDVEAGQSVIIIESMKMETEIAAAMAGSVAAIHVEAGQTVGQGDVLVEIDPSED